MAKILFLVHRLPYPPNKGDKVRSYHLLKHLAAQHEVHLGTFIDDPDDVVHEDTVRGLCAGAHFARLHPRRARLASLTGLLDGQALTLCYYRNPGLRRWVRETAQRVGFDAAVVFSSSMAPYADGLGLPMLVDFVDVDSAKWTQYAQARRWPLSWLYRREGERLLAFERQLAGSARRSFFVTEREADLFRSLAPESSGCIEAMGNGVDSAYFAPQAGRASPFQAGELPLVFTGAMDYWPNIDAVQWFVQDMLPQLRERWPALRFYIVGRNPTAAVRSLASGAVVVTGTVPDVRPYLQHAAVVVAPLRLARGLQNKVLEAMAMGRPLVVALDCAEGVGAEIGRELLAATDVPEYLNAIDLLLAAPERAASIGAAGRLRVLRDATWDAHLGKLDRHLSALPAPAATQGLDMSAGVPA